MKKVNPAFSNPVVVLTPMRRKKDIEKNDFQSEPNTSWAASMMPNVSAGSEYESSITGNEANGDDCVSNYEDELASYGEGVTSASEYVPYANSKRLKSSNKTNGIPKKNAAKEISDSDYAGTDPACDDSEDELMMRRRSSRVIKSLPQQVTKKISLTVNTSKSDSIFTGREATLKDKPSSRQNDVRRSIRARNQHFDTYNMNEIFDSMSNPVGTSQPYPRGGGNESDEFRQQGSSKYYSSNGSEESNVGRGTKSRNKKLEKTVMPFGRKNLTNSKKRRISIDEAHFPVGNMSMIGRNEPTQSDEFPIDLNNTVALDVEPMEIDESISFSSIGGLQSHIEKLKEVILFPLVYKEFFSARNINTPRGILFHGPPGTGKTMLARALATEFSNYDQTKVTVFMRKGADLLNKFVGESERHLKLLFQEATRLQPSIIFFDEIDGLAPVRTAGIDDHVHNSVVTTLLAEMDGVKDRGKVIVIGATNRIDAIDPALRRPGRFDHELSFLLPTKEGRREILSVIASNWDPDSMSRQTMDWLVEKSAGFNGADLKLLCAEASVCAFGRCCPQIYTSKRKCSVNYNAVNILRTDWERAFKSFQRSSDRCIYNKIFPGTPLTECLVPIWGKTVDIIVNNIKEIFPWSSKMVLEPCFKRLLVWSEVENGINDFLLPAVFNKLEDIPVFTISVETLAFKDSGCQSESSTIMQIATESVRYKQAAVLYLPAIDQLWKVANESARETLWRVLMGSVSKPLLVIATAQNSFDTLASDLHEFFEKDSFRVQLPSSRGRKRFFDPIFTCALNVKINRPQSSTIDLNAVSSTIQGGRYERDSLKSDDFELIKTKESVKFKQPLDIVLEQLVSATDGYSVLLLLKVRFRVQGLIERHSESHDKTELIKDLKIMIKFDC